MDKTMKQRIGLALALLAAVFLLGRLSARGPEAPEVVAKAEGVRFYVCPMNDVPPLPAPGSCPVCGMELLPMPHDDDGQARLPRLTLPADELRKADVVLGTAERKAVTAEIRLFGQIEYDPIYLVPVDAPTSGIIDKVYVQRTGDFLRPNQPLFDLYSAEVVGIELELMELLKSIPNFIRAQLGELPQTQQDQNQQGQNPAAKLVDNPASRKQASKRNVDAVDAEKALALQTRFLYLRSRLRTFGLIDKEITQVLRQERPLGIVSLRVTGTGGVVVENTAVAGRYVNVGTPVMAVANPQYVWASLRAFESDYPWLKVGQAVELTVEAQPGEVFHGRIAQLDPVFDPKTRTFGVGVSYVDKERRFRPNMLARATVRAGLSRAGGPAPVSAPGGQAALVIPETAPLLTGKRAVVYVAEDDTTFEAREVVLGPRASGYYVVSEGLKEGERVVVNGAFKLDSELQIRAKPSMMNPAGLARLAPAPSAPATADPKAHASGMEPRIQPASAPEPMAQARRSMANHPRHEPEPMAGSSTATDAPGQ